MSSKLTLPTAACLAALLVILLAGRLSAEPKSPDADAPRAKPDDSSRNDAAEGSAEVKPAGGNLPQRKTPENAADDSSDKLALEQQRIADRYKHLEDVLLRMAELSGSTDPRRAALLKKAVGQSKEQLIDIQFDRLIELLQKDQLSRAIENQGELDKDLRALLELLLSENRAKQLEAQKKRYQDYLKRINALIKEQKNLQGRTAGGEKTDRLSGEQGKLAEKTGGLAKDMHANEASKGKDEGKEKTEKQAKAEGKSKEADKGEGKSERKGEAEGQAKEKANGEGKNQKKDGDAKGDGKAEGKKAEGKAEGKKGEGKAEGKKSDDAQGGAKSKAKGQGQDQGQDQQQAEQQQAEEQGDNQDQQNQDANPMRKRLQAAQDRMQQAEEKLKQAQREGAVEKQEEALRELEQAKAALEEILRQLREEEIQRMLAMLEARFKKMLQWQREVYEATVRLDKVPLPERSQNHEIESGRLSGKESQIVVEADKARLLLHEDGSSVVFPEALDQAREDMQQVVLRLAQGKVEQITQAIESDIIAALEEMIDALKKAQKDRDKDKKKPRPRQGGQQQPPLVDVLAEIKMIRAMQMRVNTRTERYSKLIDGEQADQAELIQALQRLAEREQRIHRVTRDLELGRNQ